MNLNSFVILAVLATASVGEYCNKTQCRLPKCQCSETKAPIPGKLPQLVLLTFDDSVTRLNFENYYKPLLFNKRNPDNCPISATFFVPHEYTDYSVCHELYMNQFEIASHSITKNFSQEYWKEADRKLIELEMGGQRDMISKYANIPKVNITGSMIPQLQLNGDETYFGLRNAGLSYDSSWPTYSNQRFFAYTLDYTSRQPCLIGTCPKLSFPGMWIVPINNLATYDNAECNNLLACKINGTATEIHNWLKKNFELSYNWNRTPVTLLLSSAWFQYTENSYEALEMFLKYLGSLNDVFMVSEGQLVDWDENPVTADKYSSCRQKPTYSECKRVTCELKTDDGDIRYMTSCLGHCPAKYPWLGNIDGV